MAFVKLVPATIGCDLWDGSVTCDCGHMFYQKFAGGEVELYLSGTCSKCGTIIRFLCPPRPDRKVVTAEVQVVEQA